MRVPIPICALCASLFCSFASGADDLAEPKSSARHEAAESMYMSTSAGVPVRVVAANHDTSVIMIERTYSRHIGDHADALVRAALLDTQP